MILKVLVAILVLSYMVMYMNSPTDSNEALKWLIGLTGVVLAALLDSVKTSLEEVLRKQDIIIYQNQTKQQREEND